MTHYLRIGDVVRVLDKQERWQAFRITWAHPNNQLLRLGGMRLSPPPHTAALNKIRRPKDPPLFYGLTLENPAALHDAIAKAVE